MTEPHNAHVLIFLEGAAAGFATGVVLVVSLVRGFVHWLRNNVGPRF